LPNSIDEEAERLKSNHAETEPSVKSCIFLINFITTCVHFRTPFLAKLKIVAEKIELGSIKMKEDSAALRNENVELKKKLLLAEREAQIFKSARDSLQVELGAAKFPSEKDEEKMVRAALKDCFTKAQLDRLLLQKLTHWSEEDYSNAMVLLSLSSRAYIFMRSVLKYPLPAISSVKSFACNLHCVPGLMVPVLRLMQAQAPKFTQLEKQLGGSYDEMKVHSNLAYYHFQDRVLPASKNVQVVYVRTLFGKWGNEVFYQFNKQMDTELINFIAEQLFRFGGYEIVTWTSDLSGANRGFMKSAGINLDNQKLEHPITKNGMYFFSDAPHDLKNARNHLMDHGVVLNPDAPKNQQEVASKSALTKLLQLDSSQETVNHKMNWLHLECREQDRQKVDVAIQTLSSSVAVDLMLHGDAGRLICPHYKVQLKELNYAVFKITKF
jgi:hypothetical protein